MSDLTYASYVRLSELLKLQTPRSEPAEHDEMLFIVIHQVYELWFLEILHEIDKVQRDFAAGDHWGAIHTLKRVRMILKTAVGQLDILETMTPMSFASFRDQLETASGFQSYQFRELEYVLGYRRPELLRYHPEGSDYVYPEYRLGNVLEDNLGDMVERSLAYGFGPHKETKLPRNCRECEEGGLLGRLPQAPLRHGGGRRARPALSVPGLQEILQAHTQVFARHGYAAGEWPAGFVCHAGGNGADYHQEGLNWLNARNKASK